MLSCLSLHSTRSTGSCPESTDLLPAVVALSVVLAIVVLLLALAIPTIIFLCTSESDVKVSGMFMCAFKGMPLFDH